MCSNYNVSETQKAQLKPTFIIQTQLINFKSPANIAQTHITKY